MKIIYAKVWKLNESKYITCGCCFQVKLCCEICTSSNHLLKKKQIHLLGNEIVNKYCLEKQDYFKRLSFCTSNALACKALIDIKMVTYLVHLSVTDGIQ